MKQKIEPLKIAYSEDNFIAVILLHRNTKNSKVISCSSIFNELTLKKFDFLMSKKKIEREFWDFMRSNKLEERITIFSDPLVMLSQYIIVSISGDEMKASISVNIPERFQNMVSVPLLYRILKNSKVQAGISQDRINTLFSKLNSERTIQNFPVASGQSEIFGHDGQMKLSTLFKNKIIFDKKSKNKKSKPLPAETTDYSVTRGDILVTVYPGQKGKEGFKVNGKKLWSPENTKVVKTPTVSMGRNVKEVVHKDRIEYQAEVGGRAFFINNRIIDVEEAIDGNFSLELSKDNLSCSLILQGPMGGKEISFSNIKESIEKRGIKINIGIENLKSEITSLNDSNNGSRRKIEIAKGFSPENGRDEKIEWDINIENIHIPAVDSHGDIDYKSCPSLPFIREKEKAGILYPATKGEKNGVDIYGKEIPAEDGKKVKIEISNIFDFTDGVENNKKCKYLIAKTSGLVIQKKNEIKIIKVFETKEIGLSTGNVDFDGIVIVNGTVQDGFYLKATKEIIIKESVGACIIESKGNIQIKGGVNGGNKGKIISEKDIIVKYAENSTIIAGGTIMIEKHTLLSNIVSYGDIFIGKNRKDGKVIGSRLMAAKKIHTNYVGANTSIDSCLWAGVHYTAYNALKKIEKLLEELNTKLSGLQMELLDKKKLSGDEVKELEKQKDLLLKKQTAFQNKKNEFRKRAFSTVDIEIEIINNIQAHTMIKMAEIEQPLAAPGSGVKFLLQNGQITREDLKKTRK